MTDSRGYSEIGKFIVEFQHIEENICELIRLLLRAKDEEMTDIVISPLGYAQKLQISDVLLARFLDCHDIDEKEEEQKSFHALIQKLSELGARRNTLVHSTYYSWTDVEGNPGLLRQSSRLRTSRGEREEQEEALIPQDFDSDFGMLRDRAGQLESFRIKVIQWIYAG